MKIGHPSENSNTVNPSSAASTQKAGQSANASATLSASQSTRSAGVAVTVSTMARGLGDVSRGAAADIDTQKVASLRAAIQDGTFVVNPEAIADKLLSNAQEMLNRTTN